MSSNLAGPIGQVTYEGMGLVHSRLAAVLGVSRSKVQVVQWAGNPAVLELWTSQCGQPLTFLGTMTVDFDKFDPYELPPQQDWTSR